MTNMTEHKDFEIYPEFSVMDTPVIMCRSKKTGLKLALVSAEGPMVSLYATVATEAVTKPGVYRGDDGLPHTLEHLVFLGSKKYPFKGILDKLANRSLAEGTNAWTDVDHTAYTVSTAGQEAFLNFLPIYLDHILEPTITDEGFTTEVHHVNEKGENKGVVYCEMQGRENSDSDLCERACLAALYPESGYKSETGGLMANLRELNVEQVRQYHEEYYRPTNLFLVITGTVDLNTLLSVVGKYDSEYASSHPDVNSNTYERPWITPVAPLPEPSIRPWIKKSWQKPSNEEEEEEEEEEEGEEEGGEVQEKADSVTERAEEESESMEKIDVSLETGITEVKVEFPSEDDSCGTVVLGWRTEEYGDDLFGDMTKLDILMRYLFESAASPMTKAFVESKDAFCADTFYAIETFRVGYLQIWFEGVNTENIEDVLPLFVHTLQSILSSQEGIDMERMTSVITKRRRGYKSSMEDSPADMLVTPLIKHFLYDGNSNNQDEVNSLKKSTDLLSQLEACFSLTAEDWANLLRSKLLQRSGVCVKAFPSAEKVQELEKATAEREENTRKMLGEKGLAEKKAILDAAQEKNNKTIPENILKSVPIPSVKNIAMFDIQTFRLSPQYRNKKTGKNEVVHILNNLGNHLVKQHHGISEEAKEFDKNVQFHQEQHVSFTEKQVEGHEHGLTETELEARAFDKNVQFHKEQHVSFTEKQVEGHEEPTNVEAQARVFDTFVKFNEKPQVSFKENEVEGHEHGLTETELEARAFDKNVQFHKEQRVSFTEKQVEGHEHGLTPLEAQARSFDKNVKFGSDGDEHVSFKEEQVKGHEHGLTPLEREAHRFDIEKKGMNDNSGSLEPHVSFKESQVEGHEVQCDALCLKLNKSLENIEWPNIQLQMDQVASEFISLSVALDTSMLSNKQRLCLVLLQDVWFKSATTSETGMELSHEETVNALEKDLVSYHCSLGYNSGNFRLGSFTSLFFTNIKVEKDDLALGVKWMKQILFGLELDASRLSVACSSLLASIPEEKRSGRSMAWSSLTEVIHQQNTNHAASTPLRQKQFLTHVLNILKSKNEVQISTLLEEFNEVRSLLLESILNGGAGRLRVAGDFNHSTDQILPQLLSIFPKNFLDRSKPFSPSSSSQVQQSHERLAHDFFANNKQQGKKGLVVGLSSIENSSVYMTGKGVKWTDNDEAKLMVAIEYLTALEGDFWLALRGSGLTYGANIFLDKEDRLIYFALSRCASPSLAYLKAKEIVDDYNSGKNSIKQIEFENSKSSLASSLLSRWESKSGAIGDTYQSWLYLQGIQKETGDGSSQQQSPVATALAYRIDLISRIESVNIQDVLDAFSQYLLPLFNLNNVCFAIATPNTQCEEVAKSFGMKSMMESLLSPLDASLQDIIAIKEKELETLFPIQHCLLEKEEKRSASATDNDRREKTEVGEHVWPFIALPFWRAHPRVVSITAFASLTAVAAVTVLVAKSLRTNR